MRDLVSRECIAPELAPVRRVSPQFARPSRQPLVEEPQAVVRCPYVSCGREEDLEAHLTTAEAQVRSPKPEHSMVKASLAATKAILLGAATTNASLLLLELLKHIPH